MRQLTLVLLGTSLVATACARQSSGNTDTAESALDSQEGVESEGNVMMAMSDGADMAGLVALTGDEAAARIAANIALRWQPNGCAQVTQTGSSLVVLLDDCTGPRGLLHVTGEIDVDVHVSATGNVSVHATGNDLQVNLALIDMNATGIYEVSGTNHLLHVTTEGSGTGPRGNQIDHIGEYTISWDTATTCRSIMGHWSTEFTGTDTSARRANDVNVTRCLGGCPDGTVRHTFLTGATLTVTFDGTSIATWESSTGRTGTVNLPCGR